MLEIDGRAIGDSTEIIAALEERYPERPLYPADPEQRRRALELEDFFDEELGPHIRLLAFHELGKDRERFEAVIARTTPGPLASHGRRRASPTPAPTPACASASATRRRRSRARQDRRRARPPRGRARLERVPGRRLLQRRRPHRRRPLLPVGAARRGPLPADQPPPAGLQRFRAPLEERPGYRWVETMYERHRQPARAGALAS